MDVVVCNMCHKVEGMRLRGCYYLFGKITAMVEVHEDHRLVQLQEMQAADRRGALPSVPSPRLYCHPISYLGGERSER